MIKKTETNSYILIFSILMVLIVGGILSYSSIFLKAFQEKNKSEEKMQNILNAIGYNLDRRDSSKVFKELIKESFVVDSQGMIDKDKEAFEIDVALQYQKEIHKRSLPIYKANRDGKNYFILPLYGKGLWGPIWAYVSIDSNYKIGGALFDHASETPGLGAEITQEYFKNLFQGEHLLDKQGNYKGIKLIKSGNDPKNLNKQDNQVDGISGATITSDGVGEMLSEGIKFYFPFLNKNIKK
jgi:Na+-transporting NADH:ubiquinone oxidoreductase subunit C